MNVPRRARRNVPFTNIENSNRGPSHRDVAVQTRKFQNYNQLAVTNVEGDFAFGITNFNVTPKTNTYIGEVLEAYSKLYEQYRIRKVVIRAQCGKGYTNDRRIKTILVSRVDVDNQDTAQTFNSFRSLANATNAKTNTLTERGNVAMCEYRPVIFDQNYSSSDVNPVLPNNLQWNRLVARNNHQWRGAVLGVAIPENTLSPQELKITLTQEVTIDFRGRINDMSLSSVSAIPTLNPPVYDLTTTLDELKTELLTGAWFPTQISHSIGNIGSTVLGPDLIGNKFRIQSTMEVYIIEAYEGDELFCNIIE
jgi:hypothetical protein